MKTHLKILVLLIFTFTQGMLAQVQFESSVSRNEVPLNENVRVDFTMNSEGDNFKAPTFEGFKVVGGPNQSVSYAWTNGKKSFSKTYSFFLAPTRKGTLTIGSASIQVEDQTYNTKPISVTIVDAVKREDPRTRLNHSQEQVLNGIHLVAEISNTTPYQNEPITIFYKVYVERGSNLTNWNGTSIPKYNKFWVNSIEIKELKVESGTYNGKEAQFITFKKDILMPLEVGNIELEPLILDIQAEVPTGRRDFFGFPEMGYITKTYTTGKRTVKVKPLPEEGKPDNFSGAVGTFDFKVTPSGDTSANALESLNFKVEVKGQGNMNLFSLPKLIASDKLEVFDPEYSETVKAGNNGLQGSKTDSYTIIPQYKGEYYIDPISFNYFDIKSKSYKTISTDSIRINVINGPDLPTQEETIKESQNSNTEVFQSLKTNLNAKKKDTQDYWNSTLFYILTSIPFLLMPFAVVLINSKRRKNSDFEGLRLKHNNRLAKKYLSEAKKNIRNKELFYDALERCLHNFLKAKLNIETSEMSNDNIKELLTENHISEDLTNDYLQLKNACEYARYTPTAQANMNNDYNNAIEIIAQLEKQFK